MSKVVSPRKGNNTPTKKIINKISSIVMSVIFILVIIAFFSLLAQSLGGKKPNVFGYRLYFVLTDSMEPTLKVNDVLLSEAITSVDEVKSKVKEGDIITFVAEYGIQRGMLITHRVVEGVHYDTTYERYVVLTKGDNISASVDPPIPLENIQAKMVRDTVIFTNLYKFFTSIWGIIIILVVPLVSIMGCLAYKLFVTIKKPIKSKDEEEEDRIAEIKRKAIEEYKNELTKVIAEKAVKEYIEQKGEDYE